MLQKKTFSASFSGLQRKGNYDRIVEDVGQQIVAWANANDGRIVVEHVSLAMSDVSAHAIVLYRDRSVAA